MLFDITYCTSAWRASLGILSRSQSGSGTSWLMVGGSMPVSRALMQKIGFHSACRAEHMAGHALGGRNRHLVGVVAEGALIAIVSYFSLSGVPVP